MEQLLERQPTYEQGFESAERLSRDKVAYLGNLAIRWEVLGINDPLTHLFQYLERGDAALIGIEEDLVTDIAERLPKTPFVNQVGFESTGDDFVSLKDKVSMNSMTANNLRFYAAESIVNPSMLGELARAEVESQEAAKLADWFGGAKAGAFLIFESLPIGNQKIAISRVYQKKADGTLEGTFVSMHNPSIDQFNRLRAQMAPGTPACDTELEILSHQYEFYNHDVASSDDFVDYYVGNYDHFLSEQDGKTHSFGIAVDGGTVLQNGLAKARSQPGLTSLYTDTIKALANGGGRVNQDLLQINTNLGLNFELADDQRLTLRTIHEILAKVIIGIVSVIDRADAALLDKLSSADSSDSASYGAVSDYGGQASAEGETYSSGGCSEYGRSDANEGDNAIGSERNKMKKAYRSKEDPKDPKGFGEAKMGVCIIPGCTSHGNNKYLRDRVRVGGCSICVECHLLIDKNQSPERVHAEKRQKAERERVEAEKTDAQKSAKQERRRILKKNYLKKLGRQTMNRPASHKPGSSTPMFDLWAKKPEKPTSSNRTK